MKDYLVRRVKRCPIDGNYCQYAKMCVLTRTSSCTKLINCMRGTASQRKMCKECRASHNGECVWKCFRRDGKKR